MDLGDRIAAWRLAKGLSQRKLAKAVGVVVSAVYQWEGTGEQKTSPTQKNLEAIVKAFGITMERFYGRIPKAAA